MNYVNDEKTLANFADNDKFYSDRMENRISPESSLWNPWHGCHKLSTGCRHCYVYRGDSKHGERQFHNNQNRTIQSARATEKG